jgi:gliding motility-associated-like protein
MKFIKYLFFLLFASNSFAQLQNNNWIFGYGGSVNFSGVNPVSSLVSISSNEQTASVSDLITGQLLFYTDARNVWNANNQVMPNGAGLLGGFFTSSTQGVLIVPFPDNNQKYYIFTLDEIEIQPGNPVTDDGLRYSVVDMSLNGGLGDVEVTGMNTQLASDLTEKLIVIRSPQIQGFWIIAHKRTVNEFLAWRVDACGVSSQPVVSRVGSLFSSIPSIGTNEGWAGAMDASPNGDRIGMPVDYSNRIEFFDFDKTTGIVSNPLTVTVTDDATPPFLRKYGACFSPDGSKFYYTNTNSIYQLDLSNYTVPAITSSFTLIASTMSASIPYPCFQIEQAPNNKLYVAIGNSPRLDEISNPNAPGLACGYVINAVNLAPGVCQLGLPAQVPLGGFTACNANPCPFNLNLTVVQPSCGNNDGCISFNPSPTDTYFYLWPFPTNFLVDSVCGLAPGTYQIRITNSGGCSIDTTIILTNISNPVQGPPQNISACNGYTTPSGVTYSIPGNYAISDTLTNSVGCDSIININLTITGPIQLPVQNISACAPYTAAWGTSYTQSGTYSDTIFTAGCDSLLTINLDILQSPTVSISGDSSLCSGETITLNALAGNTQSYLWSDGSTAAQLIVSNGGTYSITVENSCGQVTSSVSVVEVDCDSTSCEFLIPNAFTPNGDGTNDNWYIQCIELYPDNEVQIFNRWGQPVFTKANYAGDWDGTFSGQNLPDAAYYYILKITLPAPVGPATFTGSVSIIR